MSVETALLRNGDVVTVRKFCYDDNGEPVSRAVEGVIRKIDGPDLWLLGTLFTVRTADGTREYAESLVRFVRRPWWRKVGRVRLALLVMLAAVAVAPVIYVAAGFPGGWSHYWHRNGGHGVVVGIAGTDWCLDAHNTRDESGAWLGTCWQ